MGLGVEEHSAAFYPCGLGHVLSSSEPQLLIFKGAIQFFFFFLRKKGERKEGRRKEGRKEGRRKETCFLHRVILSFKIERCI